MHTTDLDALIDELRVHGERRMQQRAARRQAEQQQVQPAQPAVQQETVTKVQPAQSVDRRQQARQHGEQVVAKALALLGAGKITVADVARLQSLRLLLDQQLDD